MQVILGQSGISCHFLGGSSIEISGMRAIAQTKKRIDSRQKLDGIACDVVCTGRFYQFFEQRDGSFGPWCCIKASTRRTASTRSIRRPSSRLDPELLASYPEGYRHLAYVQTKAGFTVKPDLPGLARRRGRAGFTQRAPLFLPVHRRNSSDAGI